MSYHANHRLSSAFTLVEVMIVIIIMGVMAGLAIPQYTRSVTISKERRALNNLYLIHNANITYQRHNGNYWPPSGSEDLAAINTNLAINILADGDTYTCIFVASSYQCTAQFDNNAYTLRLISSPIAEGVNPCCSAGTCPLTAACSAG